MKHVEFVEMSRAVRVRHLLAARQVRLGEASSRTEDALVVGERRDLGVAVRCDVVRDRMLRHAAVLGDVIACEQTRIHLRLIPTRTFPNVSL